jgi:hypothetical protein
MIWKYYTSNIGPIKKSEFEYGPGGVSRGIANIVFEGAKSAALVVERCNRILVNEKPIKIEVIIERAGNGLFSDMKWEKFDPLPNVVDIFLGRSVYLGRLT